MSKMPRVALLVESARGYHCQALFAQNRADVVLPVEATSPKIEFSKGGLSGVGTWSTQAEFKDMRSLPTRSPYYDFRAISA
jgi:hypothetical protein